ncbi:MAG: DUF4010 domain-containing protein [Methanocellales archaeon]|nr:DUF4010 domain-containing protein [Methanocellales archaeon]
MINDIQIYENVFKICLSVALGMFIGMEREWAQKGAGIRTFALISLCGAVFGFISYPLIFVGAIFVVILSAFESIWSLLKGGDVHLTTMVAIILAYCTGVLVGLEFYTFAVIIAIIVTALLAIKQELHDFVGEMSSQDVKGAVKFGILAFVIFPTLPNAYIDPWQIVNPRTIWLMVVLVSGFGFLNYIIMKRMGSRGIAYTGFFGGLANSTAVVGELVSRVRSYPNLVLFTAAAVILSNVAMCLRNFIICAVFSWELALTVLFPLLGMALVGLFYSFFAGTGAPKVEVELKSPFSITHALTFGLIFLCMIFVCAMAHMQFGGAGFYISEFVSGIISSASATTSAIVLYQAEKIDQMTAALGIILANISSVVAKIGLIGVVGNKELTKYVIIGSVATVTIALVIVIVLLV